MRHAVFVALFVLIPDPAPAVVPFHKLIANARLSRDDAEKLAHRWWEVTQGGQGVALVGGKDAWESDGTKGGEVGVCYVGVWRAGKFWLFGEGPTWEDALHRALFLAYVPSLPDGAWDYAEEVRFLKSIDKPLLRTSDGATAPRRQR